jgi:hypothetical protein
LKVGGLVVDRKEVMFGKVDQMSREEVEKRLEQLMGSVALGNAPVGLLDPETLEDEADSLEALEQEDLKQERMEQERMDKATDLEEEESWD